MNSNRRDHIRSFGAFEVDLATGHLRRSGVRLHLPQQSFQVLALLLQRLGDVVSREELKRRLWPAATYGDFDHGVNKAVNRLRLALGDSASNPRFIETLRRRGYRFLGTIPGPDHTPQAQTGCQIRLAVLGFENVSPGDNPDLFAEGLTEELTVQLGQIHPERLATIGRGAARSCRAHGKDTADFRAEFNLSHWVEGSVRRFGDRVRVSAQLIDASAQTQIWSENYERVLSDVFAVQSELAHGISQVIAFKLLAINEERRSTPATQFRKSVSTLDRQEPGRNAARPV